MAIKILLAFTGSAATGLKLRSHPNLLANAVRFTAEQDSLNASILGPDAGPDTPEFEIFVKEAAKEITTKAGQKCTATRRIIAPAGDGRRSDRCALGSPSENHHRRSRRTRRPAWARSSASRSAPMFWTAPRASLRAPSLVYGDAPINGDADKGAFVAPRLYRCDDPDAHAAVHETEAFGPVSTVMGYRDTAHAADLANRGGGSLVASLFTHDPQVAQDVILSSAAHHGRIYINNRDSARKRRQATDRPCRTWSMAGRAARAGRKNWAACAPSCTTCNAPPCKARPTC